jgi:hypothetical protein
MLTIRNVKPAKDLHVDRLTSAGRPSGENGQEQRPRRLGSMLAVVLVVLVGLLFFIHGCGKHDHDDELRLANVHAEQLFLVAHQ